MVPVHGLATSRFLASLRNDSGLVPGLMSLHMQLSCLCRSSVAAMACRV